MRLEEVKEINADETEYVKTGIRGERGLENLIKVQQMRGLNLWGGGMRGRAGEISKDHSYHR